MMIYFVLFGCQKMNLRTLLVCILLLPMIGFTQDASDSTSLEFRISSICDALAKGRAVESEKVGAIAFPSEQWKRFKMLLSLSNDSILSQLTEHPSPTVRVYAFWGLTKRNSHLLVKSIKKHELDCAIVSTLNGCFGGFEPVYDFVIKTAYFEAKNLNQTDRLYIEEAYKQIQDKQLMMLRNKKESGN